MTNPRIALLAAHDLVSTGDYAAGIECLKMALKSANALGRNDIKKHIFIALNVLRPLAKQ